MFWRKKKNKKYVCSQCGLFHENWPALAFTSPINFHNLSEIEKEEKATLTDDFCIIKYEDQTDFFIRVVLKQQILDYDDSLDYGLWVSLSKDSYDDYIGNFKNEHHENQYFGWLCSNISDYENTTSIPTTVICGKRNERPEIVPHEDFDHLFVKDYYNGISKIEAEKRIHQMLENLN